ncbi:hypothetical protein LguiB_034611 [Lonicera macranthoides]
MEEEMEDTFVFTFTAMEIDLDYEFDAVRYFDFSREESAAEARQAELWFESVGSYPPSPFVTKLFLREDILLENVTTSPKSKGLENKSAADSDSDVMMAPDFSTMDVNNRDCEEMDCGILQDIKHSKLQKFENQLHHLPKDDLRFTFYNHMKNDNCRARAKSIVKPCFPRTSTLMKPTASQLAKQNRPHQVGDSRLHKLEKNVKNSNNSSGIESQASKRQKLEGGHLRKVADTNQQINLVHKAPKKDATIGGNSVHAKLRLTIPRQPDLETSHRAQRMRPETSRDREHAPLTGHPFRARPLNRKILEAPSMLLPKRSSPRVPEFQEFHLKTSERAVQHASAVSSSSFYSNNSKVLHKASAVSVAECGSRESRRPNVVDDPKQEGSEIIHKFKALPLNKKIFSSKGDIGVFRNSKRETTVPMEFNFHTEKRVQHDPPVELFNKLSLTSELQSNGGPQLKLPRPTCTLAKGSKENRVGSFQQQSEIKHFWKGKPPNCAVNQFQFESEESITQIGPLTRMRRSLGIR